MFAAALVAVVMAACPTLYVRQNETTVKFTPNSSDMSSAARQELDAFLAPVVGDPLAEVSITSYFPYRTNEDAPPFLLSRTRSAAVATAAVEGGMAQDLIAAGQSAVGGRYVGNGEWISVPYTSDELNTVRVRYVVKSDCHPLADAVRKADPYL